MGSKKLQSMDAGLIEIPEVVRTQHQTVARRQKKLTAHQIVPQNQISKEGDPYSWKYYYKMSKQQSKDALPSSGAEYSNNLLSPRMFSPTNMTSNRSIPI